MQSLAARRIGFIGGTLVWLLLFAAATSSAQSLGEIARKERERRKNQTRRAARVYTEDDLKKPQILDPQDRMQALAARKDAIAPTDRPSESSALASSAAIPAPTAVASGATILPPAAPTTKPSRGEAAGHRKQLSEQPATSYVRRRSPLLPSISRQEPLLSTSKPEQSDSPVAVGVRVKRGDSLWKLAQRHLGNGARWPELAALNPQLSNPDHVRPGNWIRLPSADSLVAKRFLVRAGDTLWSVAQAEFGNARAFTCIAHANPQLRNVDLIYPGQALLLPPNCAVAR